MHFLNFLIALNCLVRNFKYFYLLILKNIIIIILKNN